MTSGPHTEEPESWGQRILAHARPARRAAWGALDQAMSSLTNFLLAVLIARSVGVEAFGAFTLAFFTFLVLLNVSRAVATEPLTIRFSFVAQAEWRDATAAATGTAIVVGLLGGLACCVAGFLLGGVLGKAVMVVGVALTPLLLQDAWRFAFFAARRGRSAFANDLLFTIALVSAVVVVDGMAEPSVERWIVAWASAAGIGATFGILQAGLLPKPWLVYGWLRSHSDLAPRLVAEGLVLSGTGYLTYSAVSLVAGLSAVAAVRAAQVLMNAVHIASYGVQLFAVPEAVALARRSLKRLKHFCLLIAGGLIALSLGWGLVLLSLPDAVGTALLGETWASARPVILPTALLGAALGAQIGAQVGLRALALVRDSLRARLWSSLSYFSGGLLGAQLAGALGTAWGVMLGASVGATVWWLMLIRALRSSPVLQPERPANERGPTQEPMA